MAPRISIFSIVLSAKYLSYVKSIATYVPTFFGYIISVLLSVICTKKLRNSKIKTYQDILTNVSEFGFNFFTVFFGHLLLSFGTFGLLLDWRDNSPGWPPGAHHILVGYAQQITLFVKFIFFWIILFRITISNYMISSWFSSHCNLT